MFRRLKSVLAFSLALFAVLALSGTAWSQAPETGPAEPDLIRQLEEALYARDVAIQNLMRRVEALEREVLAAREDAPGEPAALPDSTVAAAANDAAANAPSAEYESEEQLAGAALDRALLTSGGILLPAGTMEVEQSATFYSASSETVTIDGFTIFPVLVVGDIFTERRQRSILRSTLASRLGLLRDVQLDLGVPFGYEHERIVTGGGEESTRSVRGIGDIEIGLTRQIGRERGIRWRAPTGRSPFRASDTEPALGTGFHSLLATLTAVKSTDPLVFFGSLSYSANLARRRSIAGFDPALPEESVTGTFSPGDSFGFVLGSAMAVNPEASLSLSWDQRFVRRSSFADAPLPGTVLTEAGLRIGTSYVYAPSRAIDVSFGIGLSREVPDFNFSVAFPFRFEAFPGLADR
jgi:hypothetical protein